MAIVAAGAVLAKRWQVRAPRLWIAGLAAVAIVVLGRTYLRAEIDRLRLLQADHPVQQARESYATSSECRACHVSQFESWQASFHRRMTQRPSEASVQARFEGTLTLDGHELRLRREGERFLVDMPRPAWSPRASAGGRIERPVVLVTGSHHYQVYWVPSGHSTFLAQLPFVWLTHEGRWMPRRSVFIAPRDELTEEFGRWNGVCIRCHTTDGHPGADPQRNVARTTVAEFGIACEACHGPARSHVDAMRNPLRRYAAHLGIGAEKTPVVNPRNLAAVRASQICAQCHSINFAHEEEYRHWLKDGYRYRPGDDLTRTRTIAAERGPDLDPGYFWPDGMVRVTGREYHGLRTSPCFEGGEFSCLSCHALHKPASDPRPLEEWRNAQTRRFEDRNGLCLQCHQRLRDDEARHAHTRHAPQSAGSECVNCHMPYNVYGLGKAARQHQISVPDVARDMAAGRPNACNLCHVDRTLEWTAGYLSAWHGKPRPKLDEDQKRVAATLLHLYKGDAGQRALAVHSLGWAPARAVAGEAWAIPHLLNALDDRYEVIGLVGYRALRQFAAGRGLDSAFLDLPPGQRRSAVEKTLPVPTALTPDPARLIAQDGRLDAAAVGRLRAQRRDPPMLLKE